MHPENAIDNGDFIKILVYKFILYVDEHTLTAAISRIRGKIEKDGKKYIQTVYGMGYMFTGGDAK